MYNLKKIIILSLILAIFGFGGNVVFGKGLTNNIISQSIKNALTDENKNLIDSISQYIADDKKIALIQTDTELTEALNGLTNFDPIYLQYVLQNTADIAGAENGFTGDLQLYAMLNSGKGYSYTDQYGNIIGVNTIKTDLTDSGEIINVLFHETTNYNDHSQNEQTAINRGSTAEAIWALKNFEKENANKQTTEDWNKENINSPVILYGTLNAYKNNIEALSNPNANINNFGVSTAIGAYLLYKAIESGIETGVEYGIARLTDDQEFNPLLSFGKNMLVNSTIGLIPGTSEAKIGAKTAIYLGKLTLRTAGDTAVDTVTRDGDVTDYLISNSIGNVIGDIGGSLIKKYGGKVVSNMMGSGGKIVDGVGKIGENIDFYITPNGQAIPSTAYRAIGGKSNIEEALEGTILSRNPTYMTFDNIIDMPPYKVKNLLQLPYAPTYSVEFDTFQLLNDIKIPDGRWNTTNIIEPIVKTFPEWGTGGGTQAITNLPIKIKKINKLK